MVQNPDLKINQGQHRNLIHKREHKNNLFQIIQILHKQLFLKKI